MSLYVATVVGIKKVSIMARVIKILPSSPRSVFIFKDSACLLLTNNKDFFAAS